MKLVCISDTHRKHAGLTLPKGDVLLHCGDFGHFELEDETDDFDYWLKYQEFEHKLVVFGNHDFKKSLKHATLIGNRVVNIGGVVFGGLDYLDPELGYTQFSNLDVLLTHEPPYGILDGGKGDVELLEISQRANPKLHIFGHRHVGYGDIIRSTTVYANVSSCDTSYNLTNSPRIFELLESGKIQETI